jgi:hypothetical protein
MHFLSHYYYEGKPASAELLFGLLLPDIAPGFTKVYNRKIKVYDGHLEGRELKVHQGIQSHFIGDKDFHNQAYFTGAMENMKILMLKSGISRSEIRVSVLAHLLVEILIDKSLCISDPNLAGNYYRTLETLDWNAVHHYFGKLGLNEEKQIYLDRMSWFMSNRFLHNITDSERIVAGACRIYARATGTDITKTDILRIKEAISDYEAVRINWTELLKK